MRSENKLVKMLVNVLLIILGNAVYTLGIVLFILPTGLITGGTTGLALLANRFTGVDIPVFVAVFNVIMFVLGFAILGRKFAMSTLVSTVAYPLLLSLMQKLTGDLVLTGDLLLSSLFGGLLIGAGLAMVIRIGASTGGMDIPPLILQKLLRIPVSVSLYAFDFAILIGQMLFSPRETCLYGILLVLVYTMTLDKLLAVGSSRVSLEIVSRKHEEIRKALLSDLDRGVTLLHGRTGYLSEETEVLHCVIAPRELYKLERIVYSIDTEAFVVMSRATSVHGRGFSKAKEYIAIDR